MLFNALFAQAALPARSEESGPPPTLRLASLFLAALPLVASAGFAAEAAACRFVSRATLRTQDGGAAANVLAHELERQCGAAAARARPREDFLLPATVAVRRGTTQLMRAAARDDERGVLTLLALGAAPDARDDARWTALHFACYADAPRAARALLAHPGGAALANAQAADAWRPLQLSVLHGTLDVPRLLLARGARHELPNVAGWTALHWAVNEGHAAVVRLLCAGARATGGGAAGGGGALELRNRDGRTPLCLAALALRPECARALLDAGADLAAADAGGATALHHACRRGRAALVAMLAEAAAAQARASKDAARDNGDNEDEKDEDGGGGGGALFAADHEGRTPLHIAVERRCAAVARWGRLAAATTGAGAGAGPLLAGLEVVRALLAAPGARAGAAQLGARDARGRTPLRAAVEGGDGELVAELRALGADE